MYRSPNIVRVIKCIRLRWAGHVTKIEENGSTFKIVTGKLQERTSGRPRRRWEDNIKIDLKVIGIDTRNWVDSAKDRDYWRALVQYGIKPPGSKSHGVSLFIYLFIYGFIYSFSSRDV